MNTFNRNELALELNQRLRLPVNQCRSIVDSTLAVLMDTMASGRKIVFRGVGVFDVVVHKPKIGRNPRRPEAGQYQIPARRVVRFRMGQPLFERLNPEA